MIRRLGSHCSSRPVLPQLLCSRKRECRVVDPCLHRSKQPQNATPFSSPPSPRIQIDRAVDHDDDIDHYDDMLGDTFGRRSCKLGLGATKLLNSNKTTTTSTWRYCSHVALALANDFQTTIRIL
jgi:hypothetical protein